MRGRFVARRAWPCVGVMSMRLEGKGGGGEGGKKRAEKMDKKLPGSSELSWVRTFGRGQEAGGQRRRGTRKGGGEGGGEGKCIKKITGRCELGRVRAFFGERTVGRGQEGWDGEGG